MLGIVGCFYMYFQQKAVGHSTPHSLCPAVGIIHLESSGGLATL